MVQRLIRVFVLLALPAFVSGLTGTLSKSATTIGKQGVLELVFDHSGSYANPWEALNLQAKFISPASDTLNVGGFYHHAGQWRFRFAPTVEGAWKYQVTIVCQSDTFQDSGQFTCSGGTRPGFLKLSTENPNRLALGNDSIFYPVGLQNCGNGFTMAYLQGYADSGFNIHRLSQSNCSPGVEDTVAITGNFYNLAQGLNWDTCMQRLQTTGFRIVLNPCFSCKIFWDVYQDSAQMAATRRMIDYVVDRWGAYVDVFELQNEPYVAVWPLPWVRMCVETIRARDPYHHLVAQDLPELLARDSNYVNLFDFIMPHYYWDGTSQSQDYESANLFKTNRMYLKQSGHPVMPVIYGEEGYSGIAASHPDNGLWERIRHWSAFMNEGGFISWNQGGNPYKSGAKATMVNYSNVNLTPEVCHYIRILQNYCRDIEGTARTCTVKTSAASISRGYGVRNTRMLCAYYSNAQADQASISSGQRTYITTGFAQGEGFWYDPATGDTLGKFLTDSSPDTLTIPDFQHDIALKIFNSNYGSLSWLPNRAGQVVSIMPNPFTPSATIGFPNSRGKADLAVYTVAGVPVHRAVGLKGTRYIWKPENLPSGIYIVKITVGKAVFMNKMLYNK